MSRFDKNKRSLTSIDMFAGCGGLSLGLKKAEFDLLMANELSSMAAESFAYNLLDDNLKELGEKDEHPKKTVWLNSSFEDLSSRLRENPFISPKRGEGYSDIYDKKVDLTGKLVIADIVQLNEVIKKNNFYRKAFDNNFFGQKVDLISGGPPCQSFSMVGLREKNCDKNTLPFEFCKFVDLVKPKLVLLENVSGILRAFTQDSEKYFAWFEVAKAFASIGYLPICLHLNARHAGVPQNRPRFILIGIRNDTYERLKPALNDAERELFAPSELIIKRLSKNTSITIDEYTYFDYQKPEHLKLLRKTFLSELYDHEEVSVKSAIGDLLSQPRDPSTYVSSLNKRYSFLEQHKSERNEDEKNEDERTHSEPVKKRFRLYQILSGIDKATAVQVQKVLSGKAQQISADAWKVLSKFEYYLGEEKYGKFTSLDNFINHLMELKTKKHSQRALLPGKPAPAALSIPDDVCHYEKSQLRTLTVREMARIQSFPDSFRFRSKITTGGTMRQYEVPQYTQVGNAVPPDLGYKLGLSLKKLLEKEG